MARRFGNDLPRRRMYRPVVEQLEDRRLLSAAGSPDTLLLPPVAPPADMPVHQAALPRERLDRADPAAVVPKSRTAAADPGVFEGSPVNAGHPGNDAHG